MVNTKVTGMDGIIEVADDGYPTITAFDCGNGCAFWCRGCRCWHRHGQVADGDHRASHCWSPASPYYGSRGYLLRLIPPTAEIMRAITARKPPPH